METLTSPVEKCFDNLDFGRGEATMSSKTSAKGGCFAYHTANTRPHPATGECLCWSHCQPKSVESYRGSAMYDTQ